MNVIVGSCSICCIWINK